MDPDLRLMVLRRAAEIVGGAAQLRAHLDVEAHSIELWLSGRATPPEWVFLLAVDVVLRDDIARKREDRRSTPRDPNQNREPPSKIAPET